MKLLAHSKAPAKLILSGEHATVYGKNAVAITVGLYTEVKICTTEENIVKLVLANFDWTVQWPMQILHQLEPVVQPNEKFVYCESTLARLRPLLDGHIPSEKLDLTNACLAFLLLYLAIGDVSIYSERKAIQVEIHSQLPTGAGLGSSSSYIVALADALFTTFNVSIEKENFNKWCFEVDKLFHGKPSGVDNTICTFGGAILFGNGQMIDNVKSDQLAMLTDLQVILVNTHIPRNTKAMVESCRVRMQTFPSIVEPIFDSIAAVSQNIWHSLQSGDLTNLPVLFEINQNLLNCLNVGHEKIDQIVNIAKKYNLSAKLTGAGGGGIVVIPIANSSCAAKEELIEELKFLNFSCYQVKLGVPGVQNI